MSLSGKSFKVLAVAICLSVCLSLLSAEARASESGNMAQGYGSHNAARAPAPSNAADYVYAVRGHPFANEVIRLVNIERFHAGLPPVEVHPALTEAAQIRAREGLRLDDTSFVNHIRPDGRQWHTVLPEVNLSIDSLGTLGENVARGFNTPEQVVRAWMYSSTHRDILLSTDWATSGIGAARNDWGRIDVVQLFCADSLRPEPVPVEQPYQPADDLPGVVYDEGAPIFVGEIVAGDSEDVDGDPAEEAREAGEAPEAGYEPATSEVISNLPPASEQDAAVREFLTFFIAGALPPERDEFDISSHNHGTSSLPS